MPAAASNLVTGNGFGFGVVTPSTGTITKFYAHPYSFLRPDPRDPLSEGIPTANFIRQLGWRDAVAENSSAAYEDDSHVIHIHRSDGDGLCFMPFGFEHAALIVSWEPQSPEALRGAFDVQWNAPLRAQKSLRLSGATLHLLQFDGIDESLLVIPLDRSSQPNVASPQLLAGHHAWALIALEKDDAPEPTAREFLRWQAGLAPQALARREIAEMERWRVRPAVHFASEKERHLWRQSEVMLRIAQSREPNGPSYYGNGLIVASLPDGLWFTPWVRDMAWATVALARMGHQQEARAALLAYFNARPTGKMRAQTAGADYQISVVRYYGNGAEEPFFTNEGSTNIEFDDWGEALWALGEYLRRYHDPALLSTPTYRGNLYQSARDYIAKPLLANTEQYGGGRIVDADTSIWEEREKDKKHFAFSTAMAIVGLEEFADVARLAGDDVTRTATLHQIALLQKGFNAAFIRGGHLHGTLEEGVKNDIDGALLQIINFGVVTNPSVIRDTLQRMELLKVVSGGYRRVRSTYTDPSIYEYWYEREEFLFVDFNLAELLYRLGDTAKADAMQERIVNKAAADHDLIPEMYVALPCKLFPGAIGDPTGALPMVGYGAGEFILELLNTVIPTEAPPEHFQRRTLPPGAEREGPP
ncbi:MAG: glycoside hydrolase family 15 protein [Acidobacteriaceae bacterium]